MSNKMEKLHNEYYEHLLDLKEKTIEYLTIKLKANYSGNEDVDDNDFRSAAETYLSELESDIVDNSDDLNRIVENQ